MAFQHRLCVSADADRVAWPRHDGYEAADFELLQRALKVEGDAPTGAFFTALPPSSLPGYPGDTHFDAQHLSLGMQGFTRSNPCSVAPRLEEKVLPLLRHLRRRERPAGAQQGLGERELGASPAAHRRPHVLRARRVLLPRQRPQGAQHHALESDQSGSGELVGRGVRANCALRVGTIRSLAEEATLAVCAFCL